jgi:predicted DNA-binding transcriptional regulator AlpA
MTKSQVMDFLQINEKTLYEYRDKMGLPHFKINSRVFRYDRKLIMEWLEQHSSNKERE